MRSGVPSVIDSMTFLRIFQRILMALCCVGQIALCAAADSGMDGDVHQPLAELWLQTSSMAGLRYYDGAEVWPQLHEGDRLQLVREPGNSWDRDAIAVTWHQHKLGYVPRRENTALARLMDHGTLLDARIVRLVQQGRRRKKMVFDVYESLGNH